MSYKDIIKRKAYRWDIPLFTKKELGYDLSKSQTKFLTDMQYLENKKAIICAGQGCGKTFAVADFAVWTCGVLADILDHPFKIAILGGSYAQSKICYEWITTFINNSKWIAKQIDGEPLQSRTSWNDGSEIIALKASQKSIRGHHPDILCLDEAAEQDREIILAALPRVDASPYPRTILSSTPHVEESYFLDIWEDAEKLGYLKYQWSAYDAPWKDKEFIEEKRRTWSEARFDIEYLGKPHPMTGGFLDREDLKHSVIDTIPKPQLGNYTAMGLDIGIDHPTALVTLQEQDNVFKVLDCREWRKRKFRWVEERIKNLYDRYNVNCIYADRSGLGVSEVQKLQNMGLNVRGVAFTGGKGEKQNLLRILRDAFEYGRVKIPLEFTELRKQLGRYTGKEKRGDDLVDALMLALKATTVTGRPASRSAKWYAGTLKDGTPLEEAVKEGMKHSSTYKTR